MSIFQVDLFKHGLPAHNAESRELKVGLRSLYISFMSLWRQ